MQINKVGKGKLQICVEIKSMISLRIVRQYNVALHKGLWSISGYGYCYTASRLRDVLLFSYYRDKWI